MAAYVSSNQSEDIASISRHPPKACTLQMHDLPLPTLQQLKTYGIMHEHVNECLYH